MCTVSWCHSPHGLDLLFSRDESLERPMAEPPVVDRYEGLSTVMPIDPLGGGTWIAANDRGMAVMTLNDYRYASRVSPGDAQSRGLLVRRLSQMSNAAQVRKYLFRETLKYFPPFLLLAFERERASPTHWAWNGETLRESTFRGGSCISTSSWLPRLVPGLRRLLIRRALGHGQPDQAFSKLLSLHRNIDPCLPPRLAVAMRREGRETVSLTHLRVGKSEVIMRYWPGHPSESYSNDPFLASIGLNRMPVERG
jgi:hypothetical protein